MAVHSRVKSEERGGYYLSFDSLSARRGKISSLPDSEPEQRAPPPKVWR
jgi:hypothetical protein